MDFALSDDLLIMQRAVRDFAKSEIAPVAPQLDKKPCFPWKTLRQMGELGLLGVTTPEEYGGTGLDTLSYAVLLEEISAADAAHGTIMSVTNGLPQTMLLHLRDGRSEGNLPPQTRLGRVDRLVLPLRTAFWLGRGGDDHTG